MCNTACKPCSAGPPGNQGRRKGGINCPQTPEQLFSSIRADNEGTTPGGTRHSRIKDTEKPCSDLAEKICSIFIKTCSAVKKPPGNALLQNSVEAVRGTYGFAPAARRQHPLLQRLRSAGHCPHHFLTTLDQPCGYSLPLAFCAENAASYPRTFHADDHAAGASSLLSMHVSLALPGNRQGPSGRPPPGRPQSSLRPRLRRSKDIFGIPLQHSP